MKYHRFVYIVFFSFLFGLLSSASCEEEDKVTPEETINPSSPKEKEEQTDDEDEGFEEGDEENLPLKPLSVRDIDDLIKYCTKKTDSKAVENKAYNKLQAHFKVFKETYPDELTDKLNDLLIKGINEDLFDTGVHNLKSLVQLRSRDLLVYGEADYSDLSKLGVSDKLLSDKSSSLVLEFKELLYFIKNWEETEVEKPTTVDVDMDKYIYFTLLTITLKKYNKLIYSNPLDYLVSDINEKYKKIQGFLEGVIKIPNKVISLDEMNQIIGYLNKIMNLGKESVPKLLEPLKPETKKDPKPISTQNNGGNLPFPEENQDPKVGDEKKVTVLKPKKDDSEEDEGFGDDEVDEPNEKTNNPDLSSNKEVEEDEAWLDDEWDDFEEDIPVTDIQGLSKYCNENCGFSNNAYTELNATLASFKSAYPDVNIKNLENLFSVYLMSNELNRSFENFKLLVYLKSNGSLKYTADDCSDLSTLEVATKASLVLGLDELIFFTEYWWEGNVIPKNAINVINIYSVNYIYFTLLTATLKKYNNFITSKSTDNISSDITAEYNSFKSELGYIVKNPKETISLDEMNSVIWYLNKINNLEIETVD